MVKHDPTKSIELVDTMINNFRLSSVRLDDERRKGAAERLVRNIDHIINGVVSELEEIRDSEINSIIDIEGLDLPRR